MTKRLYPEDIQAMGEYIQEIWRQCEDEILQDVARRIRETGRLTGSAEWQMSRYRLIQQMEQDTQRKLQKYSKLSDQELQRIFGEGGLLDLYIKDGDPGNALLRQIISSGYIQTAGEMHNLTATTALDMANLFVQEMDTAWLKVDSGAFTYTQATVTAADRIADSMRIVTYPSGHRDFLEVASRRCVVTGVNQTNSRCVIQRADDWGMDFIEVSAHEGARPEHAEWQGKVYHRGGAVTLNGKHYPDFESSTGYGTGAGLAGWNCRHTFWTYDPAVDTPTYTRDQLEKLTEERYTYNGEKLSYYDLNQRQRYYERQERKYTRRMYAEGAATDETAAALASARAERRKLEKLTGHRSTKERLITY